MLSPHVGVYQSIHTQSTEGAHSCRYQCLVVRSHFQSTLPFRLKTVPWSPVLGLDSIISATRTHVCDITQALCKVLILLRGSQSVRLSDCSPSKCKRSCREIVLGERVLCFSHGHCTGSLWLYLPFFFLVPHMTAFRASDICFAWLLRVSSYVFWKLQPRPVCVTPSGVSAMPDKPGRLTSTLSLRIAIRTISHAPFKSPPAGQKAQAFSAWGRSWVLGDVWLSAASVPFSSTKTPQLFQPRRDMQFALVHLSWCFFKNCVPGRARSTYLCVCHR